MREARVFNRGTWMRLLCAVIYAVILGGLFHSAICSEAHGADPYIYNMTCYQGADCRTTFRLTGAGRAVDLTGSEFTAQVRATYTTTAALAGFTVDSSRLSIGLVTLVLPASTIAQLAGKTGYWDLRQVDPAGNVLYRVRGSWKTVFSATR